MSRPPGRTKSAGDGRRERRSEPTNRLFVAVDPPETARRHLAEATAGLHLGRGPVLLTDSALWHVTVAFLGEVAASRVADVTSALARAVAGIEPVTLRFAGGGRFGRGRATVVWTGLDGGVESLGLLARAVRRELRRARLPYDDKPYRPHLTLARPRERIDDTALREDLDALAGYEGPLWTADAVHLLRSHLGPQPRHERLASWPLKANPS